jgi:type IV pilus assembly protein PilA
MKKRGFSLLELMIVLAIIAILVAIALPIYADYVIKSDVGAVNAEVASLKTAFDICVNDGRLTPATCDLGATSSKFQAPGGNTQAGGAPATGGVPVVTMNPDGSGSIKGTFGGSSAAELSAVPASISYNRDTSSNWSCQTSGIRLKFVPSGCTAAGP